MAEESKVPVQSGGKQPASEQRHPLDTFRQEFDRLFDDFSTGFGVWPFGRRAFDMTPPRRGTGIAAGAPAVDVVEKDSAFEITAELPGLDEKNIELNLADDVLTIRGEKSEEKEEKKKDFYLSERRYGTFQRSFRLPEHVDAEKIDAHFKNGVLTVTLPKTPAAAARQRKIEIKPGQ